MLNLPTKSIFHFPAQTSPSGAPGRATAALGENGYPSCRRRAFQKPRNWSVSWA